MVKSLAKNKPRSAVSSVKKKKSRGPHKVLDISASSIVDNLVFSEKEYWAYYKLTGIPYDYESETKKSILAKEINTAFVSLFGDNQKPLEVHVIRTQFPLDLDSWRAQNDNDIRNWNGDTVLYKAYMDQMQSILKLNEFRENACFIGIKLGDRNVLDIDAMGIVEGGIAGAFEAIRSGYNKFMGEKNLEVSSSEEKMARNKEKHYAQTIAASTLKGRPATAEELLLIIKKVFYPSMPAPYIEIDGQERYGSGDIAIITSSEIENETRFLKFTQVIGPEVYEGYRATLSFGKLPSATQSPEQSHPLFHYILGTDSASDIFSRFTIHSKDEVRKILDLAEKDAIDEVKNASAAYDETKAIVQGGAPQDVTDNLRDFQDIRQFANANTDPWISGTMNLTVEAKTEEELRKKVSEIKHAYINLDVVISWQVGEQAKLFLEQMPGDMLRCGSFRQTATLTAITSTGMNYSSNVGDKIKPKAKTRVRKEGVLNGR